jgi:hypothetical protein
MKSNDNNHPFNPLVIISGILIGIIGTVIGGMIIGEGRFAPAAPTPFTLNQTETPIPILPDSIVTSSPVPTYTSVPVKSCFPQTNWTPPNPTENGEWIYDCLSSSTGNWVGQTEQWKAENWKRGSGQSEIVSILVPQGATKMGIGCNPCTIVAPNGATFSPQCLSQSECFAPFKPNASLNVSAGELYKVQIFGGDTCPSRKDAEPPCSPEIYVWFNLP